MYSLHMSVLSRLEVLPMDANWYVLRSKPLRETALWQQAVSHGFEVFFPRIPVPAINPRSRKVVPYFPGYMFVRVALEQVGRSTFQWMPNAHGLICFDDTPADVPDALVNTIRSRVEAITAAGGELFYRLKQGDIVTVKSGPFAGYNAIFDARISGGDRVRVLMALLSDRHVAVELSEALLDRR
jgi:transcription antitermination factor NusG